MDSVPTQDIHERNLIEIPLHVWQAQSYIRLLIYVALQECCVTRRTLFKRSLVVRCCLHLATAHIVEMLNFL